MENQFLIAGEVNKSEYIYRVCNPSNGLHRMIVLCLTCLITFGSYFCYDNPAALQKTLITELKMSQSSYMGLYAWYSWPNILMSFVGGFLIDNILGIRHGTIIFGFLTFLGQVILSVGVYINEIWLMNFARFIFGIGAESLAVAQNTYASRWFKDKQLNIVFGLQISISRLGSTLNSNTMQQLYNSLSSNHEGKVALSLSLLIASSTCIFSLLVCILLGYLDYRASKQNNNELTKSLESIKLKDIFKFNMSFWFICIVCISFYSTVFPFISLVQTLLVQKYYLTVAKANLANSLIYLISAIVCPFFGFGVDYFGKNLIWLTSGMIFLICSHCSIAFTFSISPFVITALMGIAYSMVASSLWGLVSYIVPRSKQGTAYGLMQAFMNLGLGTVALITGYIVDNFGYFILELFFLCFVSFGFLMLIFIFIWDYDHQDILNSSKSQRKLLLIKM